MRRLTLIIVALIILGAAAYYFTPTETFKGAIAPDTNQGPGDDVGRDCGAGFIWEESLRACIKPEYKVQEFKNVASIAIDYIAGQREDVVIYSIQPLSCSGCFRVELTANGKDGYVILNDWHLQEFRHGDRSYPAVAN